LSGAVVSSRRNHVSWIVGKHFIIHGGINEHGEYLDDIFALNLPN